MIVLLPNRREIDTMRALTQRGLSLSTVSGKRRMLNIAHEAPVLKNVVALKRRPTAQIFEQLFPEHA